MRSLVALAIAIFAATPQQQPKLRFIGESIEVSIVNVDVFVTDKAGNRVTGLTQDDFEIYEDGKLRPITNFAEYRGATTASVSVTPGAGEQQVVASLPAAAPRQKRTITIFIDRLIMRPNKRKEVFDQLRTTMRTLLQPGDRASIVTWERPANVRVRQPYTEDVAQLDRVLETLASRGQAAESTSDVDDVRREDQAEQQREELLASAGLTSAKGGNMTAMMLAEAALTEMKAKSAAINSLTSAMSAAEGQKALIFLSRRFPMNAATEFMTPQRAMAGPPGKDEVLYDTRRFVESVARTANANGVRVYAIYPAELAGAVVQTPDNASMPNADDPVTSGREYILLSNELEALTMVADRTGGAATWHPAEAIKLLDRMPDDFSTYYSLAYRVTTSGADKAHSIRVKVKRDGLRVRSRNEFVEKSGETKMGDRVIAQLFGIATAEPKVPLNVRVGAATRGRKKRLTIPVSIQLPIASLTTLPDGNSKRGAFSVYVAWTSGLGDISDVTHQTQAFTIRPGDEARAKNRNFTYDLQIVADDRTDALAVGVIDEVSKEFGLARVQLRTPAVIDNRGR